MMVLSVNAKQNVVFSARANIISRNDDRVFPIYPQDTKTKNTYYYSRLISTPALVSPSSLLLMMIPMLMLMMLLLGLR